MAEALESKIERKRAGYVRALGEAVESIVARLAEKRDVQRVILFGSYARGRRDLFTDLDLLVVMESEEDFVTRTASLHCELEPRVDMDLFAYTPEEFERLRHRGFVRRAVETGRVLFER